MKVARDFSKEPLENHSPIHVVQEISASLIKTVEIDARVVGLEDA